MKRLPGAVETSRITPHLSRRTFLAGTTRLSVAAWAGANLPILWGAEAADAKAAPGWQIGCYTRVFDQFEYPVALDAIAQAGYRYVGLMTTKTTRGAMVKATTPADEVKALNDQARQRGLKVLSVYGEFSLSEPLDAGIRGLKQVIDHTALCECPYLLLGGTTDEKLYEPYYKTVAECCDYAAAKGVTLTIKPHGGQNATGPQCRKAIERVGKQSFRLWYDAGNVYYYSDGKLDPVQDAATVDGLVVGMSVKDFLPPKEVLVNIGEGRVDFPAVLSRLKQGGFTHGPLVVECVAHGSLDTVKAAAKKARLFLEHLTGKAA
jgi:sugar phosphate isomerase/epimerase